MLDSFELEIHKLLSSGRSLDSVTEYLKEQWDRSGLSYYDQSIVALFLARCGSIEALFDMVSKQVQREGRVPWTAVAEALSLAPQAAPKETLDQIFIGCGIENKLHDLAMSPNLDSADPRFLKLRQVTLDERWASIAAEKTKKLERLKELRTDRLFEAEEKLLRVLRRQFPDDAQIKARLTDLDEHKARLALDKNRQTESRNRKLLVHLERNLGIERRTPNPDAIFFGKAILQEASTKPDSAYELAIALVMMGIPELAIEALDFAPDSAKKNWLRIEVLLENHRYLDVLNQCQELGAAYGSDPETAFSVSYAKARALWGLRKTEEAIYVLEGIVNLRPGYRSAHSLLLDWKEQAS